jgi:hypothetical protein
MYACVSMRVCLNICMYVYLHACMYIASTLCVLNISAVCCEKYTFIENLHSCPSTFNNYKRVHDTNTHPLTHLLTHVCTCYGCSLIRHFSTCIACECECADVGVCTFVRWLYAITVYAACCVVVLRVLHVSV